MFTTKSIPVVTGNGKIKDGIEVKNDVLLIDATLKFEDEKWYRLGDDDKWYYLGLGANPAYETDGEGIKNKTLFNGAFEEVS
jgi:hypothetical protein